MGKFNGSQKKADYLGGVSINPLLQPKGTSGITNPIKAPQQFTPEPGAQ